MPFWKKKNVPPPLIFKDNESFFEYQCEYGETTIIPRKAIVAIIDRARRRDDGIQQTQARVASEDGGFTVIAQTATEVGSDLQSSDLVLWVPLEIIDDPELESIFTDERQKWMGFIVSKIKPEIDFSKSGLTEIEKFV